MSHGKAVAGGAARADRRARRHRGARGVRLAARASREVEGHRPRSAAGPRRRTGTSIAILHSNGDAGFDGERRVTNLEDVFVLLTGEEIS